MSLDPALRAPGQKLQRSSPYCNSAATAGGGVTAEEVGALFNGQPVDRGRDQDGYREVRKRIC